MRPVLPQTLCVVSFAALTACAPAMQAPPSTDAQGPGSAHSSKRPSSYVVVAGDTLYAIAWRHGQDYRELARRNRLQAPYRIYPGQRIELTPRPAALAPSMPSSAHRDRGTSVPARGKAAEESPKPPRPAAIAAAGSVRSSSGLQWQWPVTGKLLASDTALARQGLEIAGPEGQAVKAAAPGEVVYSGDGLIGYGKLIIIKHNEVFLSAYAHNRRLLVREGLKVSGGQAIAEMGSTGTNQVKLYFEIRRNGKPVPPLEYLPQHRI